MKVQYKVIHKDNENDFVKAVKRHLDNGWQLQGGVSTSFLINSSLSAYQCHYFQAVVKEEK